MTTLATSILDGARLLAYHAGVVEVRILNAPRAGTVSGYFDAPEILAKAVARWDGKANIYVTANPVPADLLARANNRLKEFARVTTSDRDVVKRTWFLVDFDPARPTGVSATDAEVAAALKRRNEVVSFLAELDFPEPVLAMSGNGGHADYPCDLPNDDATTRLFERALNALKARFHDDVVHVDEAVFNAARIWKLYGTTACKGDSTTERPHRRAVIEQAPSHLVPLDRRGLERLAAMVPAERTYSAPSNGAGGGRRERLDLVGAFTARGWYKRPLHDGKHAVTCPWVTSHSGDSGVTESVLFEPRGDGDPWGFDCKHAHCVGRTIKDVLAMLGLSASTGAQAEPGPAVTEPYSFTMPVPRGHFLADYIVYAGARTDAALELHEAGALMLLAAATPNVRAMLAPYPGGLGTNLYLLIVGDSTLSRKSTAKDIARDLHDAVIPNASLADLTSPEAFIEQLSRRPRDSSTWFVDEVGDLLDKLHHAKFMAGLRGLLLTVYSGQDFRYTRHSKRNKKGQPVEDEDFIRRPHLSVLGATTPGVFDVLTGADVRSGLLPRFAVIMPSGKPARAPFYGPEGWDEGRRVPLAHALNALYTWARSTPRAVEFAPGTLQELDDFAAGLEREAAALDEASRPMLHRLAPMALKVAMLVAAGRPETTARDALVVAAADAAAAITIASRWRTDALTFARRIGETEFERYTSRALRVVEARRGPVPRRVVAQLVHLPKRVLDDVEATLQDRGLIHVERREQRGRPTFTTWEYRGGRESA